MRPAAGKPLWAVTRATSWSARACAAVRTFGRQLNLFGLYHNVIKVPFPERHTFIEKYRQQLRGVLFGHRGTRASIQPPNWSRSQRRWSAVDFGSYTREKGSFPENSGW
jgi:hypothetical protein